MNQLNPYLIAIDIGTTSTKGLAITNDGVVLSSQQIYYPVNFPHAGYAEQDPEKILDATIQILKNIAASKISEYNLIGISFSSAMHSIMEVTTEGNPVTPLVIWADTRSRDEASELNNSETGRLLHIQTGTPIHPMSPLCKLIWWRKNFPSGSGNNKFISIKEFVVHHLTGEFVVDYSIASATGMFDIRNHCWHPIALELTGLREDQLSKPVSPHYKANIKSSLLESLGVSNVPLIIGASDGCLAQLGSSAMKGNELTITIGTSAAVRRALNEYREDHSLKLFNYILDERTFVSGGASNNGTAIVDWFNRKFCEGKLSLIDFVNDALKVEPGCEGLIALPYLQGERAPIYNPDARGVFFGVGMHHGRSHFMRAIIESICYEVLSIVKTVEEVHGLSASIIVGGGFTYSHEWIQLLSTILNRTLIYVDEPDTSSMGAAILGFESLGIPFKSSYKRPLEFNPDQTLVTFYSNHYKSFLRLYNRIEPLF